MHGSHRGDDIHLLDDEISSPQIHRPDFVVRAFQRFYYTSIGDISKVIVVK